MPQDLSASVRPIRLMILDGSPVSRQLLSSELGRSNQIHIVACIGDPAAAWEQISRQSLDVVLIDVESPRIDGIWFLRKLMQLRPLPVIALTSATARGAQIGIDALDAGALELMCKPGPGVQLERMTSALIDKLLAMGRVCAGKLHERAAVRSQPRTSSAAANGTVFAIGASTGGVQALDEVLSGLPADAPGMVIVQHLPPHLTAALAQRLQSSCAADVREAVDGDVVSPGRVLLAPGGSHMLLRKSNGHHHVELKDGPEVFHQKPSIDVLFNSVARAAGSHAVGALLTGSGSDGAAGLMSMRRAGDHTVAQDEDTSVAFDTPGEAIRCGAVEKVVPLEEIAMTMLAMAG
jgi:two-component system, chemotaxis family, protein-glutamate methylesterase/glutaminase